MNFQEYLKETGYTDASQEEFQKFLKTKNNVSFSGYGKTVRGMPYVGSILASEPSDNSIYSENDKMTYFIDAHFNQENGITGVTDPQSDPDEIKMKENNFYYYPNTKREKYAFTVKIYTSRSVKKLEESYHKIKPGDLEILFFLEDNTGDKTDFTFGAVSVGRQVNSNLTSTYESHVKSNTSVKDFLIKSFKENTGQTIDPNFVDEILRFGKAQYPLLRGISGVYKVVDFITFGAFTEFTMEGLSSLLEFILEYLNKAKINEESWNPDTEKEFSPLFYPSEAEKALDQIDDKALNQQVQRIVRKYTESLKNIDKYIIEKLRVDDRRLKNNKQLGLNDVIYSAFTSIHAKCLSIINDLENFDLSQILKTGIRAINAFACGLWNSLVDAIAGLLTMVKMIVDTSLSFKDLMKNLETQLPKFVDRIEEALQAWEKLDFKQCVLHFIQKTLEANLTMSIVKVAYYIGCFYGFILSLVIEVVIGILISGGVLAVEEIARRVFQELFGLVSGLAKGVKNAFNFSKKLVAKSYSKIVEGLDTLIEFLKKGTDGIKKLIDDMYEIGSKIKEFIIEAYNKLFNPKARKKLEDLGLHPTRYEKGVFHLCPIS